MRRALVTGGSKGIGLATADALADAGNQVTVLSRSKPERTAFEWIQCDVLDGEATRAVVDRVMQDGYDILVNNVGGGGRWGSTFEATQAKTYSEVYQKNAWAALVFTRACVPHMREAGWGRVVTVTSIFGKEGGAKPWFSMAKAAEIMLMKELSKDKSYVRRGVTFNSIAPGRVSVGKPLDMDPENLPMGRFGKPEEVAAVIAFLCSEEASFVNGALITCDGGESVSL